MDEEKILIQTPLCIHKKYKEFFSESLAPQLHEHQVKESPRL
ncbi:hypothetical protein Anacy_1481 [Anabaena cylindrica PCC 7122]|uniref:Uncharacterized protein n=1 Tax=Anabaena cylindrica (strain ATCC 27899 / PCC 7122) TaxID=272123 RepID=K9ZF44_ANACC|nr:hypothetical protein Anacy_1481 [Anabaena cylindrica PCC 7122]BAY06048.1 hypothetical protein NIES19_53260 [Anabaena cylindrica PCC 7122]